MSGRKQADSLERGGEAAPSNGLPAPNQLLVKHEGRRPLFASTNGARDQASSNSRGKEPASPRAKTGRVGAATARRAKSEPQAWQLDRRGSSSNSNSSLASSAGTRIPRPSSSALQRRRPISLTEAFSLAEAEERAQALEGSPSPAPRPWRARGAPDETSVRRMPGEDHVDTRARTRPSAAKPGSSPDRRATGPPSTEPARELARATGNHASLRDRVQGWKRDPSNALAALQQDTYGGGSIPDLMPGIQDVPLPSVEAADRGAGSSPRKKTTENTSPDKSFAWQIDDDFTAGDVQVSDSPRIKVGSNRPFANRPSLIGGDTRIPIGSPTRLLHPTSKNTKLDEIRARERAAEQRISIPDRNKPRPKNTKLDEIRQREAEGLSKRAYAAARLEEIREQNSMSRSVSPEEARPQSGRDQHPRAPSKSGGDGETKRHRRPQPRLDHGGERIPDTPITVYKNYRNLDSSADATEPSKAAGDRSSAKTDPENQRRDPYNLLRRLARATSASPGPEAGSKQPAEAPSDPNDDKPGPKRAASDNGRTALPAKHAKKNDPPRLTVGFAGLPRPNSTDSAKSKRSSVHSEMDPTDRIEAEMKLFAPHEIHSERGSIRGAPSSQPGSGSDDDDVAEATPKAPKHDLLSMPTPRVTGAYVETPATARVERGGGGQEERDHGWHQDAGENTRAVLCHERASLGWRSGDQDTASDPGTSDHRGDDAASAAIRRRRARSLPRRRPPLRNSAKLPSVKDDLFELQRIHNIDDSTMENLEELLSARKIAPRRLEQGSRQAPASSDDEDDRVDVKREQGSEEAKGAVARREKGPEERDVAQGELAQYDRMSKSLRTGLLGIRTAKQGIERLEGQFSHARPSPSSPDTMSTRPAKDGAKSMTHGDAEHETQCPACAARPNPKVMAYMHVPVPRLFHTTPRFRLTLLGLAVLVLSLWYAAESAMCAAYCRPTRCSSTECVYSFDDPTFGYALPVKLDEWTTDGSGRKLLAWAVEEAGDWMADVEDAARGRTMADMSVEGMSFEQKRRHRRRLSKKGLLARPGRPEPRPEQRAKWDAWRRTRLAKQRAREAREMGYNVDDGDEAMGGDERVG